MTPLRVRRGHPHQITLSTTRLGGPSPPWWTPENRLEISNLYVPKLQRDLGVVGFIREHLGRPVASTAVLAKRTEAFYAEIRAFAAGNGIPVVEFASGQRKDEVMRERLAQFLAEGRTEGVVFIGRAQEKVSVWATTRRRDAEGNAYPWIVRDSRVVTHWYFYCHDACAGPFFLKYCGYFPYNARLCCNGNEYAKAMAARAGIGFTPLDNGFAAVDDAAAVQQICDSFGEQVIWDLAAKWMALLPCPFTGEDNAAGYRYEVSVLQAEFSLTQVLDAPVTGRIFFEQVIRDNLDIGRPDQVGLIFARQVRRKGPRATPGRFRTRVITEGVVPTLHIDYKHSKIKQYHKEGKALRTETTINDSRKAHTFEATCARWCLKFTGWRAGCLGPGQPRRAGRRRGPCRGPRRRAWGPGWRRGR